MRITDLARCEARPGRVMEWTLHPSTIDAAAALADDLRPLSHLQQSHLRTARTVRDNGLTMPTWIGTRFSLPGPADPAVLEATLLDWTLRHETLRSGFRRRTEGVRRFTIGAGSVALHRHEAGVFDRAEELVTYLQNRFDAATNALEWPNYIYAAVLREDGTDVYLAFDHSNVDAYSLFRIPAEVHELYDTRRGGGEPRAVEVGSYLDFCELECAHAEQVDEIHSAVARWREFIAGCDDRLPRFPLDLGLEPEEPMPAQRLMTEMLVGEEHAAGFERYCRPFGGTLAGILAASALIARDLGGHDVYRTVVPFHTRAASRWQDSLGWYVGVVPIEIPAADAPDFRSALAMARSELHANRRLARTPLARILHLLGSDFRPTSPDLHSLMSFVDARAVPGAERWTEQNACATVRVSHGDQACVWITRLHEGLHLACRHPDTTVAAQSLRAYADALRDTVVRVAEDGGDLAPGRKHARVDALTPLPA
ncbi:condensation domain-containing protein [Kitasatospora sp. NPDC059973]|uniref:condensation domain-containing protein n=1 Tax=Kitasatospora sp. NPDC059973 TaxID=3347020 RepID=UPI0036839CD5